MRLIAKSVLAALLGVWALTMWSSPVNAANSIVTVESGAVGFEASLVLDAVGNPVISYSDEGNEVLRVAHCDDPNCEGGGESVVTVDSRGNVGDYTSLVLDGSGNPVISYSDISDEDLKLAHCDDPNCENGGESFARVDGPQDVGTYTSLMLDAVGNPVISYHDGTNGDLKLAHCNDPNCVPGGESTETVDGAGTDAGTFTSLVLDSAGNPVISYFDQDNTALKVAHCDDPNCSAGGESIVAVDGDATDVGTHNSLVLDALGYPVISYYDGSNSDLKIAHCDDPNCSAGGESIVAVDGADNVGIDTSLELDGSGHPVVSYYDGSNGDLKLAHCNDANCADGDERIVAVDSTDDVVGFDTSLELDATGNPMIAYRDSSNNGLKLAHCDTADCAPPIPTCLDVAATIVGTGGNDDITGTAGADVIVAGGGDDTIDGLAGDDRICGGDGADTVTYASSATGVSANLSTNTAVGDGNDRFASIENLVGSPFGDVLWGSNDPNTIQGGDGPDIVAGLPGNDLLLGGNGNDLENGGDDDDEVIGDDGDDRVIGGPGDDHLVGAAGVDAVMYTSSFSARVSASLATNTGTGDGEDVFDSIENLVGTQFNDVLTGDDGANHIEGSGGDDEIHGGAGDDIIAGQAGADTASFAGSPATVTASLAAGTAAGEGTDQLSGFENLSGSSYGDTLTGDDGNNAIAGGTGNDVITGGTGNDWLMGDGGSDALVGGPGDDNLLGGVDNDSVSYTAAAAGVSADLTTNVATGDGNDLFDSIEHLTGSEFGDVLVGNASKNNIVGRDGNDEINGAAGNDFVLGGGGDDVLAGSAGDDSMTGQAGIDRADFEGSLAAVDVDLTYRGRGGTAVGEGNDLLIDFEDLGGSDFADVLTGDGGANTIYGGDGADVINGGDANDELFGDRGADTINGGPGDDRAVGGDGDDETGDDDTINGDEGDDVLDGEHGDDHLAGGPGNDRLLGGDAPVGDDTLAGGPGDDFLAGEGGSDTATYAASEVAVMANLATNSATGDGNDELYVENLVGSPLNDLLVGDDGANTISGGDGDDFVLGAAGNDLISGNVGHGVFVGGDGNDTFDGGSGNELLAGGPGTDTVRYHSAPSAVHASLTTSVAAGGAGSDALSAIENLTGSPFNDTLSGHAGANVLNGGSGNDLLNGVAGNDQLNGGNGVDTATYATAPSPVKANLTTNRASGGAGNDRLVATENLMGSAYNDTLTGNLRANALSGGNGNDVLNGVAGNDHVNGGNGADTATYATAPSPVKANLTTNRASGGAGNDRLVATENLIGSTFNDMLTGNAGANTVRGGNGNDRLSGVAGNDRLVGSNGNDQLHGRAGNDVLLGQSGNDALNCGANFDRANGGSGADSQTLCEVIAQIR
jgi:Ca2+-binding RTX toxin-like protein